jgi:O-antigen/teichoic acid export membrane protein
VPTFFALAVRRGVLQATGRFGRLAVSQFIEPATRLAITAGALAAGFGTSSAAIGLLGAFAAGWLVSRPSARAAPVASEGGSEVGAAVAATVLLLVGQVVIANGDLWVVSAMRPEDAGAYAAVALIGRLVYVAAWSIATVLFPTLVSGATGTGIGLLRRGVAATAVVGGALSAIAFVAGDRLVVGMVGDEFQGSGNLLGPYALATTLFVMSNLVAVADLATGRRLLPAVMAMGALLQTAALIPLALGGIHRVVLGQLVAMGVLFAVSAQLSIARHRRSSAARARPRSGRLGMTRRPNRVGDVPHVRVAAPSRAL